MKKEAPLFLIFLITVLLVLTLSGCFLFHRTHLEKPTLVFSSNGSTGVSTNITFSWNATEDLSSLTYHFSFGTSTNFSTEITTLATYLTKKNLSYSTTYYWQVSVTNKSGNVAKSEVWHFKTMALPAPSTPVLSVASVSTDTVSLEWTKSTNAASILLYSSTSTQFSKIAVLSGEATAYTVIGLEPANVYKFFVVAWNTSGSATSHTVVATTQSLPVPPSPVLPSTPVLEATSTSTDTALLEWTKSENASKVEVYSATSTQFSKIATLSPDATTYTAKGLKPSTTYKFQVVGVNPAGRATSNVATAITKGLPIIIPSAPLLSVANISTDTIALQWTKSDNASFITLYQATNETFSPSSTLTGVATSYIAKNLAPDTVYSFFIVASNSNARATSNTVVATTMKIIVKPSAPELSVNSPNTYSAVLTWTESSTEVSGFHIWRRERSNEAFILIKTVSKNVKTYTDIVKPGYTYSYMISTYNSAGQSFSKSRSVFVGQNYFPMKTSNSLITVNVQPSVLSQSVNSTDSSLSLLDFIQGVDSEELGDMLIPVDEMVSYQKSSSDGTTTYTVNVPCAFFGELNVDLDLNFIYESGRIYLKGLATYPIPVLDSVYGSKPSAKIRELFLKPNVLSFCESYSRTMNYISKMTFGSHVYRNVLKVTLTNSNITLVLYFAPNEGLMKFEVLLNDLNTFSYTVTSTDATISPIYPQPPIVVSPSENSTVPSTFDLEISGNASDYIVYLDSQMFLSTSSTTANIGSLSDGKHTLVVKARNSYGLEALSKTRNFTVQANWIATPTYVVGNFTNWATASNYLMEYDPITQIYSLSVNVPSPNSSSGINEYMIEQVYDGKITKYGYQSIPVSSGSVTFYFNKSIEKPFISLGIGDTSKESMEWYFTGDINNWGFSQLEASGTTFVATVATTGVFDPGTYEFKITPQSTFSTTPATLMPYYFNGAYGAYYLPNANFQLSTPCNAIVVKFNVLNSQIDFEATNIYDNAYLRSSFSSWYYSWEKYKFKYDPDTGIYSLTTNVPSATTQQSYKIFYDNAIYGGPFGVNIPVESGTVTFYFDKSIATDWSKAIGIGDTSKESMNWYFSGTINDWNASPLTYVGNGIFEATFTHAGGFEPQMIEYKITNNKGQTNENPYCFNGSNWYANGTNDYGTLNLSVAASEIVIRFNVLKSLVTLQPVVTLTSEQ